MRGEKWLWAAPVLFGGLAFGMTFGPNAARRSMGWPQPLETVPDSQMRSMALSGNGEILAGSSTITEKKGWKRGSGTLYLWDARTLMRLPSFPPVYTRDKTGFTNGFDLYAVALSPDAKRVGFSRVIGDWTLYEVGTQKMVWRFPQFVSDAQFSKDGKKIALSGEKFLFLVASENGKVLSKSKRSGTSNSKDLSLSNDGALIANIGPYNWNDPIEIHRTRDQKLLRRINSKGAVSVRFSPDDKSIVVAASVGNYSSTDVFQLFAPVRCYDVATGKPKWEVKAAALGGADGLHSAFCDAIFSLDGRTVAAYQYQNGQIFLLSSATGAVKKILSLGRNERSNFFVPPGLAFSPDGKRLFARGRNAVLVWDLK